MSTTCITSGRSDSTASQQAGDPPPPTTDRSVPGSSTHIVNPNLLGKTSLLGKVRRIFHKAPTPTPDTRPRPPRPLSMTLWPTSGGGVRFEFEFRDPMAKLACLARYHDELQRMGLSPTHELKLTQYGGDASSTLSIEPRTDGESGADRAGNGEPALRCVDERVPPLLIELLGANATWLGNRCYFPPVPAGKPVAIEPRSALLQQVSMGELQGMEFNMQVHAFSSAAAPVINISPGESPTSSVGDVVLNVDPALNKLHDTQGARFLRAAQECVARDIMFTLGFTADSVLHVLPNRDIQRMSHGKSTGQRTRTLILSCTRRIEGKLENYVDAARVPQRLKAVAALLALNGLYLPTRHTQHGEMQNLLFTPDGACYATAFFGGAGVAPAMATLGETPSCQQLFGGTRVQMETLVNRAFDAAQAAIIDHPAVRADPDFRAHGPEIRAGFADYRRECLARLAACS